MSDVSRLRRAFLAALARHLDHHTPWPILLDEYWDDQGNPKEPR